MRLFSTDLLRHFAIGFIAAAAVIAVGNIDQWGDELAPPAQAAAMIAAPEPAAEFVIAPEGT